MVLTVVFAVVFVVLFVVVLVVLVLFDGIPERHLKLKNPNDLSTVD